MPMPKKPLGNDRFGRLAVVGSVNGGWLCKCDCGTEKIVSGSHLRTGAIVSCGCFHAEQQRQPITHGKRRSRVYSIWINMIQRCTNENNPRFQDYGARGIAVCDEWRQFENFYADMGDPPDGMSIAFRTIEAIQKAIAIGQRISSKRETCDRIGSWPLTVYQSRLPSGAMILM